MVLLLRTLLPWYLAALVQPHFKFWLFLCWLVGVCCHLAGLQCTISNGSGFVHGMVGCAAVWSLILPVAI